MAIVMLMSMVLFKSQVTMIIGKYVSEALLHNMVFSTFYMVGDEVSTR
jgi:O-phosphoseryl-tRNA(Cys) synthetase